MSETKAVAQLYCQKARANTTTESLKSRLIVLVVEDSQHMIYYYDGSKFIKKFGPLTSASVITTSKKSDASIEFHIDHLEKTSSSGDITLRDQSVYYADDTSYLVRLNSNDNFLTLYLKYDDYKKDPLQLQKENMKNFINKLVTTMPF